MKPVAENVKFPEVELEVLQFWDDNKIFEKTLEKTRDQQPFIFYDGPAVRHRPCRTTAICWPERSKISFRASGPCVAAMWTVALAGTATACRSKWKLSRPWTCTARVRSSALGWPTSTPSAARSCCAIPRSGKRPCAGPVAGSIFATTTGTMDLPFMETVWWGAQANVGQGPRLRGL